MALVWLGGSLGKGMGGSVGSLDGIQVWCSDGIRVLVWFSEEKVEFT